MGCGGSKAPDQAAVAVDVKEEVAVKPVASGLQPVAAINLEGVIAVEIDVEIKSARNLVAMDRGGTSDPYCVVRYRNISETSPRVDKTLDPMFNWRCKFQLQGRTFHPKHLATDCVRVCLFDYDKGLFDRDDPMGEVVLPMSALLSGRNVDRWLPVQNCKGCSKASGEVHIVVSALVRKTLSLKSGDSLQITDAKIGVALGWDMIKGRKAIDLDTSVVAMSDKGQVLLDECAYF
jgi:Ca2+-dependent lipid-binding protein